MNQPALGGIPASALPVRASRSLGVRGGLRRCGADSPQDPAWGGETPAGSRPVRWGRLLAWGFCLALSAGLPSLLGGCRSAPPSAPQPPKQISAPGRLQPRSLIRRLSVPAALSRDRLEKLLVREGDRVSQGQALAILSSHATLQAALEEVERLVDVSRSQVAQVEAASRKGEIGAQQQRLQNLERRLATEQLSLSQEAKAAGIRAESARLEAERYDRLYSLGGVTELERDRYRTLASTTQAEFSRALEKRSGNQARLRAEIASARQTLIKLQQVRPEDMGRVLNDLRRARAARDRARKELELATVRAPESGRILRIFARSGERVGQDGILEMSAGDTMIATAEVDPGDLPRLSIGQGATIRADGLQGGLRASLQEVLPQLQLPSTFAEAPAERRVFEVHLTLHPTPQQQRMLQRASNLPVRVVFDPIPGAGADPGPAPVRAVR